MKGKASQPDVKEFAARVHEFLERMRQREEPMVLSVDGKPALVVLDLRLYEFFAKSGERELVELLQSRIKVIDSGEDEGVPVEQAFREIRRKLGIKGKGSRSKAGA